MGILHLSGLITAMSPQTTQCCLEIVNAAKAVGTLVSFDLNYRASFWAGRETELRQVLSAERHLYGDLILDTAGQKGAGKWTGIAAARLRPVPTTHKICQKSRLLLTCDVVGAIKNLLNDRRKK